MTAQDLLLAQTPKAIWDYTPKPTVLTAEEQAKLLESASKKDVFNATQV